MQSDAKSNKHGLPEGCIPFFELDRAINKLVMNNPKFMSIKLFGKRPQSTWPENNGAYSKLRQRALFDEPDVGEVVRGISAYLLERLIFPSENGREQQNTFLFYENNLTPVFDQNVPIPTSELLRIIDPAQPPSRYASIIDALAFIEFGRNRQIQRPFIDPTTWAVLDQPRYHLCADPEDQKHLRFSWLRLKKFGRATLVFRKPSKWSARKWTAKSIAARGISPELNRLIKKLPTPKDGADFEKEVNKSKDHYCSLGRNAKNQFVRAKLATALGFEGLNPDDNSLRTIWDALIERLPADDQVRLRTPGKRKR